MDSSVMLDRFRPKQQLGSLIMEVMIVRSESSLWLLGSPDMVEGPLLLANWTSNSWVRNRGASWKQAIPHDENGLIQASCNPGSFEFKKKKIIPHLPKKVQVVPSLWCKEFGGASTCSKLYHHTSVFVIHIWIVWKISQSWAANKPEGSFFSPPSSQSVYI